MIWFKQYYGSEEWERDMISEFQKKGLVSINAFHKANFFWKKAQPTIEVELVEKETHHLFHSTIRKIGLTDRTFDLSEVTHQQLSSVAIFFDSYSFSHPFFKDGVLYCGDLSKGEMAFDFFKHHNYYPKQIVALDDRRVHLETILEHSIELLGFHYKRSLDRFH